MKLRQGRTLTRLGLVLAASWGIASVGSAVAADSATQVVTFSVQAVNEIAISGGAVTLTINSATAGSPPTDAVSSATSYAITTNQASRKITATLASGSMPSGVTLKVALAAPAGAASLGPVALTPATAADVVTGISGINEAGKTITYTLSATTAAGVVAAVTRDVTFTIADGGI
jgi:hypothetical protein